jgi:hypothetical protein
VCYEAVRAVLGARGAPEEPLDVTEDHEEEATAVHRLRRRPSCNSLQVRVSGFAASF